VEVELADTFDILLVWRAFSSVIFLAQGASGVLSDISKSSRPARPALINPSWEQRKKLKVKVCLVSLLVDLLLNNAGIRDSNIE
jgi:hypothetical protein